MSGLACYHRARKRRVLGELGSPADLRFRRPRHLDFHAAGALTTRNSDVLFVIQHEGDRRSHAASLPGWDIQKLFALVGAVGAKAATAYALKHKVSRGRDGSAADAAAAHGRATFPSASRRPRQSATRPCIAVRSRAVPGPLATRVEEAALVPRRSPRRDPESLPEGGAAACTTASTAARCARYC